MSSNIHHIKSVKKTRKNWRNCCSNCRHLPCFLIVVVVVDIRCFSIFYLFQFISINFHFHSLFYVYFLGGSVRLWKKKPPGRFSDNYFEYFHNWYRFTVIHLLIYVFKKQWKTHFFTRNTAKLVHKLFEIGIFFQYQQNHTYAGITFHLTLKQFLI